MKNYVIKNILYFAIKQGTENNSSYTYVLHMMYNIYAQMKFLNRGN